MTVSEAYSPPLFSIAPMMGWTDNHYRTLARLITKHAWLYTEMLAAETIVYQEDNLVLKWIRVSFSSFFA
jgi:tRNA-dihydrouridine synthase A